MFFNIPWMQIWRTTRSAPAKLHESGASWASGFWFDVASPEKCCLSTIYSVLFRYAYKFWCSWIPPEGIEIVRCSLLRENSDSLRGTKRVHNHCRNWSLFTTFPVWKTLQNQSNDELRWCLAGCQHDCTASTYLLLCKEKFLLKDILSQKKLVKSACTLLRLNRTKQISPSKWTSTTPPPLSLKPVKALSWMTPTSR